jgi:hypothetical protein
MLQLRRPLDLVLQPVRRAFRRWRLALPPSCAWRRRLVSLWSWLVVVLESRQRWFDAGLGDRIERWIERNPQIVCAGRGRARILCSGPYAGARGDAGV